MDYDPKDPKSIEAHAKKLVGMSLREACGDRLKGMTFKGKGKFGQALEKAYFGISPGNSSLPDFVKADVELKSFPLKMTRKGLAAKERISLGMIDYHAIIKEKWSTSKLLRKSTNPLFVAYLYEKGRDFTDFLVKLAALRVFPIEDLKIIRDDWMKIWKKIDEGRAHELSEGDTFYLGAVTKHEGGGRLRTQPNSKIKAKPRAFSLKIGYVNRVVNELLGAEDAMGQNKIFTAKAALSLEGTFEHFIEGKFRPYIGMDDTEIIRELGLKLNRKSKDYHSRIARGILGIHNNLPIAEFEKAEAILKTVRVNKRDVPKEDISFPAFSADALTKEEWAGSEIESLLSRKFLFVVFKEQSDGAFKLRGVKFWNMPMSDLQGEMHIVWKRAREAMIVRRPAELPKASESHVGHVRPHGRKGSDTDGSLVELGMTKQCFWLNRGYISDQVTKGM